MRLYNKVQTVAMLIVIAVALGSFGLSIWLMILGIAALTRYLGS